MSRLVVAAATLGLVAGGAAAQTDIEFTLDWKFEGPGAAYFAAIDNGHFAAAGLNVTISAGQGSLDAIPKVATGAFPFGFADINSLAKFLDQNAGAPGQSGHDGLRQAAVCCGRSEVAGRGRPG